MSVDDAAHILVEAQRLSFVHFFSQPGKKEHYGKSKKEPDDKRLAEYANAK